MDFSAAKFWLDLVVVIGLIVQFFWVKRSNKDKATTKNIVDLRKHVDELQASNEKRLTRVESEITHLPTHTDLKEINKSLSSMEGTLKGLSRAVDLMNEYLLNRKDK
jgi:hypothetical protein